MNDEFDLPFDQKAIEEAVSEDLRMSMMDHSNGAFFTGFRNWVNGTGEPVTSVSDLLKEDGIVQSRFAMGIALFQMRDHFIAEFGYSVPTPELINAICNLGPVLEIGAGHGTLSRLILNAGGDAIATDKCPGFMAPNPSKSWTKVIEMDATEAVVKHPERAVLCSWPSLGETWLTDAVKSMKKDQVLIVIGESNGGCTASDCFFDLIGPVLKPDQAILGDANVWSFPGIHDQASAFLHL